MKIYQSIKIFILFAVLFVTSTTAQTIDAPKVDKRVELLSIVFRLADAPEYNFENYKDYTDSIHKHFDQYKAHQAVKLAKKLHEGGAGYSYVASLAVHLEDVENFKLAAPLIESETKAFGGQRNIDEFLAQLKDFYKRSKFEEFWTANLERYQSAEKNFEKLSKEFHPEWYGEFYGQKSKTHFKIVIALSNGNNFYGSSVDFPDNSRDLYAVFAPLVEEGEARLPDNALSFTVHEFNHSFANPFVDKFSKEFELSAKKLFQKNEKEMSEKAYTNWKIMTYESLVRAATATYLLKYNPKLAAGLRSSDMFEQKFYWVDAFTDLLKTYESNRKTFSSLDDFLPKMTEFFDEAAKTDAKVYKENFDAKSAHVVKIEHFENNSTEVNSDLTEIRIIFDKPLDGKSVSINTGEAGEEFPELIGGRAGISFDKENREFVMKIKLKPKTKYGFVLTGSGFQTTENYPLKDYKVSFQTK